jgi:hypothetical protein
VISNALQAAARLHQNFCWRSSVVISNFLTVELLRAERPDPAGLTRHL